MGAAMLVLDLLAPIILWQIDMPIGMFFFALIACLLILLILAYLVIPFKDYGLQKK